MMFEIWHLQNIVSALVPPKDNYQYYKDCPIIRPVGRDYKINSLIKRAPLELNCLYGLHLIKQINGVLLSSPT